MQFDGSADNTTSRSSPTAHTFDSGADEIEDKNIRKVPVDPVDDDLHGKEVLLTFFDSQDYSRNETWLTISQVNVLKTPLRAVSQRHEVELMKSIECDNY